MKISAKIAVFAAIVVLFPGCGKNGPDAAANGADGSQSAETAKSKAKKKVSPFPVDNLKPDTVIITVNGSPIRQADYALWHRVRNKMFRVANKIPFKTNDDKTQSFERDSRMRIPVELIRREMFRQEAEKHGIKATEEDIAKGEKKFMETLRRPKEKFSNIAKYFGEKDAEAVKESVYADVRDELLVIASSTNNLRSVSEEEIDAQIKYVKEWNERAKATNDVQRARALQAKEEILDGGIFAVVASNRADRAQNEGTKWTLLDIPEALEESEALGTWLAKSDVGDISDPIELEDGLSVIGVLQVYDDPEPPEGEEPQRQYELVRCVFDVYETIDEPDSREELAEEMLSERKNAATRELAERLFAEAKVEFPLKETIFMPKMRKPAKAGGKAAGKKGNKQKKPDAAGGAIGETGEQKQ